MSEEKLPRYCMAGCGETLKREYVDEFVCTECGMRFLWHMEGNTAKIDVLEVGSKWGEIFEEEHNGD